jgi:hypothetical protein
MAGFLKRPAGQLARGGATTDNSGSTLAAKSSRLAHDSWGGIPPISAVKDKMPSGSNRPASEMQLVGCDDLER